MNNTPAILWHEWFDEKREREFRLETEQIWELLLRNGIATTVFKKWLREKIVIGEDLEIDNEKRNEVIAKWLREREIPKHQFEKDRIEILEKYRLTPENFDRYCENELKAAEWARKRWETSTPQLYLEYKDRFDMIKIRIISVDKQKKGIILEAYQALKEKEIEFAKLDKELPGLKYSTNIEGNWFRIRDMKKEISYRAERMKKNTVCKPFELDEKYIIIELLDQKGSKLEDEIKEQLEIMQLGKFLDYGVNRLLELAFTEKKDS